MLDSETEGGRRYIEEEALVAERVGEVFGVTPLSLGSATTHSDRLFSRDGTVVSIVEIKSRNMSLSELENLGSYLLSYHKIDWGIAAAQLLHVPFLLFVSLMKSNHIVYWTIANGEGNIRCNFQVQDTKTQATCNGGVAVRENAYIFLDGMKVLRQAETNLNHPNPALKEWVA